MPKRKKNTRLVNVFLNLDKEAERQISQHLDKFGNMGGYIKTLIWQDMNHNINNVSTAPAKINNDNLDDFIGKMQNI